MKTFSQSCSKMMIVILIAFIPFVSFSQTKDPAKTTVTKSDTVKKVRELAPTHSYWAITGYGAFNQFNGDLSKNLYLNDHWRFGAGLVITKKISRVLGVRFKGGWVPLAGSVSDKFLPDAIGADKNGKISQNFKSWVVETDINATINWVNWIMGYKPERFFSSYVIGGIGLDHTQGAKYNNGQSDVPVGYLGYPSHKGADLKGYGNNSGIGSWNMAFKAIVGLGFDFNINKHWSINPELLWRWQNSDDLDMTKGGSKAVKEDMYSGITVGLTYKFAYSGCSLKEMQKNYGLVKYEVTPAVLIEKGDSVMVTVKATVPPKYFCPTAAMYFQPQVKYDGGMVDLKPITLIGEKVVGDGTKVRYMEGGTFTYTTIFPYKPEMATSQLVVAPIIYDAKNKVYSNKADIKANAKYIELGSRDLAPGIIYTSKRVHPDFSWVTAPDKYIKEVIQSKTGIIFFKKDKYDLDLKTGINKTQGAQDGLTNLNTFTLNGWKIKDITIDGWASPEGEETRNIGLSENRSKTGNSYTISQFQDVIKKAQKDNKDKKAVKAMIDAGGKDVNFILQHHGPDWNGFLKNVQTSNVKDKDKILNVINSAGDEKKKEQEIRNMLAVYPELEKDLLPPLRRAEITANLYEPKLTDAELVNAAKNKPESLGVEELLYSESLVRKAGEPVSDDEILISENAAKVFPNDWRTQNNAAVVNIKKGNFDKASGYLQKAQAIAPNNSTIENNIGVVAGKQKDLKKAETQFKKAQQLGENENNNIGILAISKGDYGKANNLLGTAKCTYNLGLTQLISGNVSGAQTTLGCAPQTPENYYLLAICGARTNNTKNLYDNLMKAVADPKLKEQAKTDREFLNYQNTPDFKNIVK